MDSTTETQTQFRNDPKDLFDAWALQGKDEVC
jgi:hypothetical protein